MQWSLVKTWAKEHNFTASRKKSDNTDIQYEYFWHKTDQPTISGTTTSLSKLATAIFNQLTDNKFVEYQKEYQDKMNNQELDHNELSGQW